MQFLNRYEVADRTNLSVSTIKRLESEGHFPRRVQVTKARVAWLASEIDEWLTPWQIRGFATVSKSVPCRVAHQGGWSTSPRRHKDSRIRRPPKKNLCVLGAFVVNSPWPHLWRCCHDQPQGIPRSGDGGIGPQFGSAQRYRVRLRRLTHGLQRFQ